MPDYLFTTISKKDMFYSLSTMGTSIIMSMCSWFANVSICSSSLQDFVTISYAIVLPIFLHSAPNRYNSDILLYFFEFFLHHS